MAFPKDKSNSANTNRKFGSTIAEDEKSNINWQKGGLRIGTVTGRLKTGKQSISSLNKGVCTYQENDSEGSKGSDKY